MKQTGFRRKTYQEIVQLKFKTNQNKFVKFKGLKTVKKPKRLKLKSFKKLKKELYELSHTHVRKRDSVKEYEIAGYCITCGKYCEGGDFQAGHFEPSGSCGLLLKYHPHNMHGQGGYCCNINRNHQQKMGVEYTIKMQKKYGYEYVDKLRSMKQTHIQGDRYFYNTMIELYKKGDEGEIIKFLEAYL